jgi:prolycopene isomerase
MFAGRYLIPGGSAGRFKRDGYTFDNGPSMMFGFGDSGTTNLLTRCLAAVGKKLATVPDPTQVHYHLPASERHPGGLNVQVGAGGQASLANRSCGP